MWRVFWDLGLKALQLLLAFALNQVTFYVMGPDQFVMARQALATHDWIGAFWSPFMVRWQHGASEVPFRHLLQVAVWLGLIGTFAAAVPLMGIGGSLPSVTLVVLATSAYAFYKRMQQVLLVHLVTIASVRRSVQLAVRLGLLELVFVGVAVLIGLGPLPAWLRFGLVAVVLTSILAGVVRRQGFSMNAGFRSTTVGQHLVQLHRNGWLLAHNLALTSYFYIIQVLIPQRFSSHADLANYQFIVSWVPIVSGVLFSYTEFLRPAVFGWAKQTTPFPLRRCLLFGGAFIAAGAAFVLIGFPVMVALNAHRLSLGGDFWLWLACGIGASCLALAYLLDLPLVALHAYRRLALITISSSVMSLGLLLIPTVPVEFLIVSFPLLQLTFLLVSTVQSRLVE